MQTKNKKLRLYALTAVLMALIFVFTAFLQLPLPSGTGYIHFGDVVLYVAAALLPTPYAIAAASVGEAMSDVLTGYPIFAPATLVIKAVMVLLITCRRDQFVCTHNVIGAFTGGFIGVWGYFFYEAFLYHSLASPLIAIPMELLKCSLDAGIFLIIGRTFDRMRLKNRLALQSR